MMFVFLLIMKYMDTPNIITVSKYPNLPNIFLISVISLYRFTTTNLIDINKKCQQ